MEQLDSLFFAVFQYYKPKHKAKANDIALLYVLIVQASALLLLGTFSIFFFNGMHMDVLSQSKACILFAVIVISLMFRNWLYYTGKKRKVLNTKMNRSNSKNHHILVLWMIPLVCFALAILLMQRL